ncbi:13813_t:CDS:2 [Rhizophagus irregularis]|nr:13813_t:CDS:2 [Rhizophagus irregularis]
MAHKVINSSTGMNDFSIQLSLRASFVINETLASLKASLSFWPLSTRVELELAAIFLTLFSAPENATVNIHTDSLSAIYGIIDLLKRSGGDELNDMADELKFRKFVNTIWYNLNIDWNIAFGVWTTQRAQCTLTTKHRHCTILRLTSSHKLMDDADKYRRAINQIISSNHSSIIFDSFRKDAYHDNATNSHQYSNTKPQVINYGSQIYVGIRRSVKIASKERMHRSKTTLRTATVIHQPDMNQSIDDIVGNGKENRRKNGISHGFIDLVEMMFKTTNNSHMDTLKLYVSKDSRLLLRIQLLTRIQLWLCPYETIDSLISDECKRALFLITKIAVINALAKTVESYIDYQMSTCTPIYRIGVMIFDE